jgi:hypothetical protein
VVGELVRQFAIVALQETHGNQHDLHTLHHIYPEHLILGSFSVASRGGGLVFIIDRKFAMQYQVEREEQIEVRHTVPGRVATIRLPATNGLLALEVTNVHFEVDLQAGAVGHYGARAALARTILRAVAPRSSTHTLLVGDWNSTASDDPRFNPVEGTFSAGRGSIAKILEQGLTDFTELFQPHFTRRGLSGGVIVNLSRIDRIYSNQPTCELLDRKPMVATLGLIMDTTTPSDHIPVTVKFFPPPAGPPSHPTIASWIAKHPFFPIAVTQLWRTARHVRAEPMARLSIAKEVLHAAAIAVKKKAEEVGATTIPEKLHWALLAFRGLRMGDAGRFHLRRAAGAFPDLASWLPGGTSADDPHKLGDLVADLAAKTLNTDILETMTDEGPPSSKGRTKLSKLHSLAATWRSQRRRLILTTIVDSEGNPQDDPESAAGLLEDFWAPVFKEKKIDPREALKVMPFTPKAPPDIEWKLDKTQFREIISRPREGAPGPDGIPYTAWRLAGTDLTDILYEAYAAFMSGEVLPADFNECLLVFIPKGDEAGDHGTVARAPGLTRPISLSNTASKFFALAINRPLAQVAQVTVHPRQRGFVGGRSITDNVIEIEGFAQSYAIADAEDPAILLFDIRAAFPSLAHVWLWVVLIRMGIPKEFIAAIQALYHGGLARVVLMGARWGGFPILSGIRQGCPASGSLFALAIDPCIRYLMACLGPRGLLTAYADDIAAAVKELFEALRILDAAFKVVGLCSALELHPGKVVIIPLWKYVEAEVRAAVAIAAPRLQGALIQNYGKLLGILIGPGAAPRQWFAVREELRSRSRFLASLGMAWSGTLPLYRSHVLPVASHVAQLCHIPKELFRTEASCLAVILKVPYRAVPIGLLRSGRSFGLSYDLPDLRTLGIAATYRAAENSGVLVAVFAEHARARRSRNFNISPYLKGWTHAGVVGHLRETQLKVNASLGLPPLGGRGLQARITKELRKEFNLDLIDATLAKRTTAMTGVPISMMAIGTLRGRLVSLRSSVSQVVQSSVVRSICNAWTTTGRFSGPRSPCPFGCRTARGDRWAHFPHCTALRRMWAVTCPSASMCFAQLTLETALLLSPGLLPDEVVQVALWTDVVGHCANDARAAGIAPSRVLQEGGGMMAARLRFLAVQSDSARTVIRRIRAAPAG